MSPGPTTRPRSPRATPSSCRCGTPSPEADRGCWPRPLGPPGQLKGGRASRATERRPAQRHTRAERSRSSSGARVPLHRSARGNRPAPRLPARPGRAGPRGDGRSTAPGGGEGKGAPGRGAQGAGAVAEIDAEDDLAGQVGRYAHARQFKRLHKALRRLKGYTGRVLRDIERQLGRVPEGTLRARLVEMIALVNRLLAQKPKDKSKLYSLHEPAGGGGESPRGRPGRTPAPAPLPGRRCRRWPGPAATPPARTRSGGACASLRRRPGPGPARGTKTCRSRDCRCLPPSGPARCAPAHPRCPPCGPCRTGQVRRLWPPDACRPCLLYTSDAADQRSSVDLGGRRIITKKKSQ